MERKAIHAQLPFLRCPFQRHVQTEAGGYILVGLKGTRDGDGLSGVDCGTEMAMACRVGRGIIKREGGGRSGDGSRADEGERSEEDGKDEDSLHDTESVLFVALSGCVCVCVCVWEGRPCLEGASVGREEGYNGGGKETEHT
jgi:hypothetical protein